MSIFEEYVPEWGWLCMAAAEGEKPLINSRADERRYKTILYKKAEIEMAKITDYTCKNGTVAAVIRNTDMIGARRVVNAANASFAKYKKLAGENVVFANWQPEPLQSSERYMEFLIKIFNLFYVADIPI